MASLSTPETVPVDAPYSANPECLPAAIKRTSFDAVSIAFHWLTVILVLGLIAGLANLRMAIVNELTESGLAILALNQGFTIAGLTGCSGSSGPSGGTDTQGTLSLSASSATNAVINSSLCP